MSNFDEKIIQSLASGTEQVLNVQAAIPSHSGAPFKKGDQQTEKVFVAGTLEITSPEFSGSIRISFPKETFLAILEQIYGQRPEHLNQEMCSGAGELLNMIYGVAKRELSQQGVRMPMVVPTVLADRKLDFQIDAERGSPTTVVPFSSDKGQFYVEIRKT